MASPLVRRQIIVISSTPVPSPSIITLSSLPSTSSTSTGGYPPVTGGSTGLVPNPNLTTSTGVAQSSSSKPSSSVSPTSSTVSPVSSTPTPSPSTGSSGEPVTNTVTSTDTTPTSSGITQPKGNSFLGNKPLAGSVFGLAGLGAFILIFLVVTSYVRRRNRHRLLAEASTFTFDPKDVEDAASDDKHSNFGPIGRRDSGNGYSDYPSERVGFAGVGTGSITRPGPSRSPPINNHGPQDYGGYNNGYPNHRRDVGNAPVRYNPSPNPYEMRGPRNGGGYPNGQSQRDSHYAAGLNGDHRYPSPSSIPPQLQPGVRPTQGTTYAPNPSNGSSLAEEKVLPRLPTPRTLPGPLGQRESVGDVDDDAYGGASLGPDSSPPRTLHVANM